MKKILLLLSFAPFIITSCSKALDEPDERDYYIGDYTVTDACDAMISDYDVSVFKSDYSDEIVFGFPGLFEAGYDVSAIVTGMKIVIPIQDFTVSTFPDIFYEFSGSGSLEDTVLTVDYMVLTIQDGLIIDQHDCVAHMVRK